MASIQAPDPALQKSAPRAPRTLLQVEDNPANAELVKLLIARRSDLRLLTATRAQQGVEMACAALPDLILMDMRLPDMSGLSAIALLRGNPATAHVPVIALSSNAFPDEIKRCLDAGVFRYLTKPYKINELMAVIDLALRHVAENRPATACCAAMRPIPSGEAGHIQL
jgi:CheY-like chemotaxis protein